jgi:hypothetical protein
MGKIFSKCFGQRRGANINKKSKIIDEQSFSDNHEENLSCLMEERDNQRYKLAQEGIRLLETSAVNFTRSKLTGKLGMGEVSIPSKELYETLRTQLIHFDNAIRVETIRQAQAEFKASLKRVSSNANENDENDALIDLQSKVVKSTVESQKLKRSLVISNNILSQRNEEMVDLDRLKSLLGETVEIDPPSTVEKKDELYIDLPSSLIDRHELKENEETFQSGASHSEKDFDTSHMVQLEKKKNEFKRSETGFETSNDKEKTKTSKTSKKREKVVVVI